MVPKMGHAPSATCAATADATSICFRWSFWLLPCEQSIITRSGRPQARSRSETSFTDAAS